MSSSKIRRFTYGDQFAPDRTPLVELLDFCNACAPDRGQLQETIRVQYFSGHGSAGNSRTMAMNCLLSLNAYGIIRLTDNGKNYELTPLAAKLTALKANPAALYKEFAFYILTDLEGLILSRLIENIRARGEQVTLEYLGEEMNELGIKTPPSSTYISTMRAWLAEANVFRSTGYEVNWDVLYDVIKVDADVIDQLYSITTEQKHFLLSLINLDIREFEPSNKIANHTRSVYKIGLSKKNLVKDVLEPLEAIGLVETQKVTTGRGAKPHEVKLTDKAITEVLQPLLKSLADITLIESAELNKTFEVVVAEMASPDKHIKGLALELFAVWIVRLLGLRFSKWRMRHFQSTGGGEVDVMAASDKIVYNRWQIQCKNQVSDVSVDVVAKEVGISFITKADVIMVVTTGKISKDAINYANQVTDNSRYYVVLLEGEDVDRIVADRTRIVEILNQKARRTFAKKELGIDDDGSELSEEYTIEEALEAQAEKEATAKAAEAIDERVVATPTQLNLPLDPGL
jgi:hypothetical protein